MMSVERSVECLARETEIPGETPPNPRRPPQIPHELAGAQTLAASVRGRRLTAWAMARPKENIKIGLGEKRSCEEVKYFQLTEELLWRLW
jgi:hypothetical protein